jgi:mono/diheme cytochrome c family protein
MISRPRSALILCSLLALVACAHKSTEPVASRGATLFAKNCSACHGEHGTGPIGPSLLHERAKRNVQEVRDIIINPDPPMPKLYPRDLTDTDVADLAAFVETL